MTHSRTDQNQNEIVEALRKAGAVVIPVNKQRDAGFDIVVAFRGCVYLVEVKQPGHLNDLTPGERARRDELCRAEVPYYVVTTERAALQMIGR